MKNLGLASALLAATLFLVTSLRAQAPKDAKGGMTPPTRAEEMLQRYDKNGDGRIDEDERIDAKEAILMEENNRQAGRISAVPGGPDRYRARLMELFDADRDGRLDDEERKPARRYAEERGISESGEVREYIFRRYDRNGDGTLDEAEHAGLQAFMEGRARLFAELREDYLAACDVNQDGKFDAPEMAVFEAFFHRVIHADPAAFPGADLNGNGALDFVEWLDVREQLRRVLAVERAGIPAPKQDELDRQFEQRQRRREELRKKAAAAAPVAR